MLLTWVAYSRSFNGSETVGDSSVSCGEERQRKTAFWPAMLGVVVAASIVVFTIFAVLYEFTMSRKILRCLGHRRATFE
jgi:hypothetical protein